MNNHPALQAANVAVVTGGADGIGLAIATRFQELGLKICIADHDAEKLSRANEKLPEAMTVQTDVSNYEQVCSLKDAVYEKWGQVDVLVNNAGTGFGTTCWTERDNWAATLNVNLWGVVNGLQAFIPDMLQQNTPAAVINTGSKQGITNPPGDPAYNVSKAAIKALTEQLAHSFRNTENCQLTAHLLVPGFVFSGFIRQFIEEKPESAWLPEQVAEFLVEELRNDRFYILCPDGETTREMDNKRMLWAAEDMIENRPALSRWHPDFEQAFAKFME